MAGHRNLTEERARRTWCPFAGPPRLTRRGEECLGSDCGAWLWVDDQMQWAETDCAKGDPPPPAGEGWKPKGDRFRDSGARRWYQNWERPNPGGAGIVGG